MNIYIDESGSFVNAPTRGSWNTVVAYVSPEPDKRKVSSILKTLKKSSGHSFNCEVKLKNINEQIYIVFLESLIKLNGLVFCTATDAGYNTAEAISEHQKNQVASILKHIDKMKYESGQDAIKLIADQVSGLSHQLYVQLYCQIDLIHNIISRAIPYYIQRMPNSLRNFRWRIDQKNATKIDYEDAFEKLTPALLQTRSLNEPLAWLDWIDYSPMRKYIYEEGEAPAYLNETYGLNVTSGINIGKIVRENISFDDSKQSDGIQVADLLAAGFRRSFRNGFNDNNKISFLLSKLLLQNVKGKHAVSLLGMQDSKISNPQEIKTIQILGASNKKLLAA